MAPPALQVYQAAVAPQDPPGWRDSQVSPVSQETPVLRDPQDSVEPPAARETQDPPDSQVSVDIPVPLVQMACRAPQVHLDLPLWRTAS